MGFLFIFLAIVLAVSLSWLALGPVSVFAEPPPSGQSAAVTTTEKAGMDRETLARKLRELASRPPPKDLETVVAMCYKMAAPPETAEYVCPVCHEKTLYGLPSTGAKDLNAGTSRAVWVLERELDSCRRLVKEIKGLAVELDESQFCRKCSPNVKEPALGLVVRYSGQKTAYRVWGVTADDLLLLNEFLSGKDRHAGGRDEQTPMKSHLERLEELLGVKLKADPSNKTK
jgi:hypothetical protein